MLMPILGPDQDWHQNSTDPHADPTPSFTDVGNSEFFLLLFVTALSLEIVLIRFQYFGQHIEIFWNKVYTDPDLPL
jgi:hypothetical protein